MRCAPAQGGRLAALIPPLDAAMDRLLASPNTDLDHKQAVLNTRGRRNDLERKMQATGCWATTRSSYPPLRHAGPSPTGGKLTPGARGTETWSTDGINRGKTEKRGRLAQAPGAVHIARHRRRGGAFDPAYRMQTG